VGANCEFDASEPDWPASGQRLIKCHTPKVVAPPHFQWQNVDFEANDNPYVCGGHGQCSVSPTGNYGSCICEPGWDDTQRCTTRDKCVDECNTDPNKAWCNKGSGECHCQEPWFTATARPALTDICNTNGCVASVIGADNQEYKAKMDAGQCICPTHIPVQATLRKNKLLDLIWTKRDENAQPKFQGPVGCRLQCPIDPKTGQECSDGVAARCLPWPPVLIGPRVVWTELLTRPVHCDCDTSFSNEQGNARDALILNVTTQSCERYCIHGNDKIPGKRGECVCDVVEDKTFWQGSR
jgi:hypothetical protein